jgi:hypothetical protein
MDPDFPNSLSQESISLTYGQDYSVNIDYSSIHVQPETGFLISKEYSFSTSFEIKTSNPFPIPSQAKSVSKNLFSSNMILPFPALDSEPK